MSEYRKFGTTDLLMLAAILVWAVNFSAVKIALREMSPLGFNGLRLPFAVMALFLFLRISREGFAVSRADLWKLMLLGFSGNTLYQLFFIHGIDLTTASNTAIIIGMSPIFIALLSSVFRHESIHPAAWAGILISFIGFYFVITHSSGGVSFTGQSLRGDLFIFFGNLFWCLYTVLSKPLLQRMSPLKMTALSLAFGTLFFLPFAVRDILQIPYRDVSSTTWALLLFSGLFAIAVCYIIWYASVKRVGNSKTAVYDNLVPVFTVLFAYFFLGERLTPVQIGGAVVIFLGVYLARSGYRFLAGKS